MGGEGAHALRSWVPLGSDWIFSMAFLGFDLSSCLISGYITLRLQEFPAHTYLQTSNPLSGAAEESLMKVLIHRAPEGRATSWQGPRAFFRVS